VKEMADIYNFTNPKLEASKAEEQNYKNIRKFIPDFYSIFPDIKRFINQLFFQDDAVFNNHLKRPFVAIYDIASNVGIDTIHEVPMEIIGGKHATLHHDIIRDEYWTMIFISKNDSQGEKNFSIGHEIFHYIFRVIHCKDMPVITEKINIWTEQLFKKYKEAPFVLRKDYELIKRVGLFPFPYRHQSKKEKSVARINTQGKHPGKRDPNNIEDLKKDIADDVENEIADYFAANLVVPTERFVLWEDKSINKIARAFRVDEKCIEKRMTEIPFELDFIKSLDTELEV
jgi:hypothetical protein